MATRGFTRASGQDVFSIDQPEQLNSSTNSAISGREAKNFYENLIRDETGGNGSTGVLCRKGKDSKQQSQRNRVSRRRTVREMRRVQTAGASEPRSDAEGQGSQTERAENNTDLTDRTVELQGLRLLRCAYNGDISGLKDLISRGSDVNFQVQQWIFSVVVVVYGRSDMTVTLVCLLCRIHSSGRQWCVQAGQVKELLWGFCCSTEQPGWEWLTHREGMLETWHWRVWLFTSKLCFSV